MAIYVQYNRNGYLYSNIRISSAWHEHKQNNRYSEGCLSLNISPPKVCTLFIGFSVEWNLMRFSATCERLKIQSNINSIGFLLFVHFQIHFILKVGFEWTEGKTETGALPKPGIPAQPKRTEGLSEVRRAGLRDKGDELKAFSFIPVSARRASLCHPAIRGLETDSRLG